MCVSVHHLNDRILEVTHRRRWNWATLAICEIEHRLRELFRVANRVMVLNFGEKLVEGSAEEVMADPRVREAYFGSETVEEVMDHA